MLLVATLNWNHCRAGAGHAAILDCPGCGRALLVAHDRIAGDGRVDGRVQCPDRTCGFSAAVRLETWVPPAAAPPRAA